MKKAEFAATFEVLARYANEHDRFNLTECTRWTRARLADQGSNVSGWGVGWVVKGAVFGDFRFDGVIEPEAIRGAFVDNTVKLAQARMELSEEDEQELRAWLA